MYRSCTHSQYATNDGVTDCDPNMVELVSRAAGDTDDLSDQPCRLSLAKNKDAVVRVGMLIYISIRCTFISDSCDIF